MSLEAETEDGNLKKGGKSDSSSAGGEIGRRKRSSSATTAVTSGKQCCSGGPPNETSRQQQKQDASLLSSLRHGAATGGNDDNNKEGGAQVEETDDNSSDSSSDTWNKGAAAGGNNNNNLKTKWEDMFDRLVAFREKNGHCLVPNRYPEDPQLGSWVSTQRRQYKILISAGGGAAESSSSTPMTQDRANRLSEIGFEWSTKDPRHVPWESRYDELVEFVSTYGHAQVPIGWEDNIQLSNWVSTQRQEYKLLRKGRSSRLTHDRIALLEKIHFVWEAQRGGPRRKRKATVAVPAKAKPVEGVGPARLISSLSSSPIIGHAAAHQAAALSSPALSSSFRGGRAGGGGAHLHHGHGLMAARAVAAAQQNANLVANAAAAAEQGYHPLSGAAALGLAAGPAAAGLGALPGALESTTSTRLPPGALDAARLTGALVDSAALLPEASLDSTAAAALQQAAAFHHRFGPPQIPSSRWQTLPNGAYQSMLSPAVFPIASQQLQNAGTAATTTATRGLNLSTVPPVMPSTWRQMASSSSSAAGDAVALPGQQQRQAQQLPFGLPPQSSAPTRGRYPYFPPEERSQHDFTYPQRRMHPR